MGDEETTPWMLTDSKFNNGKSIGISPDEYSAWKTDGQRVLEVGTGKKALAFQEILKDGIDIIGIEPGLSFKDANEQYVVIQLNPELNKRIVPLKADSAINHPLMTSDGVDIVFAQGPNFAQYAKGQNELLAQIRGLIRCLKNKPGSRLIFEGVAIGAKSEKPINLEQVLDKIGARHETKENEVGVPYISIYRLNSSGQDISDALDSQIDYE